jgi:uncharacterized protein
MEPARKQIICRWKRIGIRGTLIVASLLGSVVLLSSCTSQFEKNVIEAEKLFFQKKFKEAARLLLKDVNGDHKNVLLAQMECGAMLNAAGDYENSSKVFIMAGETAKKIPISISQQGLSLMLSDTVTNYTGEDFERVLVHMYAGMAFLLLNKSDEARVEFKRVNDVLDSYRASGYKSFKQNVMAKYLTAVAFEAVADAQKDMDDLEFAYVELKQIHQLDPQNPFVKNDLVRIARKLKDQEEISNMRSRFPGVRGDQFDSQLVTIFQNGMSSIKVSRGRLLSDAAMEGAIRIAFQANPRSAEGVALSAVMAMLATVDNPVPKYRDRTKRIDSVVINVDGVDIGRTYALEDISSTAKSSMEEKYFMIRAKVAAGIVVKAIAAVAAAKVAESVAKANKNTRGVAGLIGALSGGLVGAGLVSQIKPDLRCWHSLPDNLQLSLAGISAGKHAVRVKFMSGETVLEEADLGEIEAVKDRKVFLNFRTVY